MSEQNTVNPTPQAPTPQPTPAPIAPTPQLSLDAIGTSLINSLEQRGKIVEGGIMKSFTEQYGISREELEKIVADKRRQALLSEVDPKETQAKGGMILFVLGAATLDAVLGLGLDVFPAIVLPFEIEAPVTTLVLIWYILTEIGSLFENAQKLGASFPPGVQKIIDTLKGKLFPSEKDE